MLLKNVFWGVGFVFVETTYLGSLAVKFKYHINHSFTNMYDCMSLSHQYSNMIVL